MGEVNAAVVDIFIAKGYVLIRLNRAIGSKLMRTLIAAAALALLIAPTVAAQPVSVVSNSSARSNQATSQSAADYTQRVIEIITEISALMSESVDLCDRYALGFSNPDMYAQNASAIAANHSSLSTRVAAVRASVASLPEPIGGKFQQRSAELRLFANRYMNELGEIEVATDRLPALIDERDAEGFEEVWIVLNNAVSSAARAENAILQAQKSSTPPAHPEYHLSDAAISGNLILLEVLDIIQNINSHSLRDLDGAAQKIASNQKAIVASVVAGETAAGQMRAIMKARNPTLRNEIDRLFEAYDTALAVERRYSVLFAEYIPIAKSLAAGEEFRNFEQEIATIGKSIERLSMDRQAANASKIAAARALSARTP